MTAPSPPDRDPFAFEVGPIRPPSEARSLLLRVTRNCPWNRCTFCPVYKGKKFSRRAVEEVEADIDAMAHLRDWLKDLSREMGFGGVLGPETAQEALQRRPDHPGLGQFLLWLLSEGHTVFLQDANSLVMKPPELARILRKLREHFPAVTRITSYARSHTLSSISVDDLRMLRDAGLDRIHVGLESGSDAVLERIRKGCTQAEHIEAGQRVIHAGMELSEYVMPGLGGVDLSDEHADETADALNQIKPHFIRLRTLGLRTGTELRRAFDAAGFLPLPEDDVVREIRRFIARLSAIESTVVSDHILNLLEAVEGRLPGGQERMLGIIDAYLALPEDDRLMFRLGRRMGALRDIAELEHPGVRERLAAMLPQLQTHPEGPEAAIRDLLARFI